MAQGVSLHIGLNAVDPAHYAGWSGPLAACEADAEDMAALAKGRGFKPKSLLTKAATRAAAMSGIESAARALGQGDIFFLTYSGHGGQLPDRNGDEPDDMLDETWCLYDGELIDDELNALWVTFKPGVRILMLSDSCHSGTVARMALSQPANATARGALGSIGVAEENARFRVMPPEVALRTYRKNAAFYDGLQPRQAGARQKPQPEPQASVRLISGCQDNQLSSDGTFNGLFTGMLLRVWNDGKFKGKSYDALHKAIVKRMPPTQTPKHLRFGGADPAYDSQRAFTV